MSSEVPGSDPVIAVAQFAPGTDCSSNLERMHELAQKARVQGASLVVFPEYSSYFAKAIGRDYVDAAQSLDGPFVTGLIEMSDDLGLYVVAGLVERLGSVAAAAEHFANTLVAIAPRRGVIAKYRKL